MHVRHSLELPVDLIGLAKKYGTLRFIDIPCQIDGITANLKVPGTKPTILVNKTRPKKRQRFTLAHEIGHVVIPWHMGTIFDITDAGVPDGAIDYWDMEAEANAFATELLMPSSWMLGLLENFNNPAEINEKMAYEANVSAIAATLRLKTFLPPGYIFVVYTSDGKIAYSGRTEGTHASPPARGEDQRAKEQYGYAQDFYEFHSGQEHYLWIEFPSEVNITLDTKRKWRDVLDEILDDVTDSEEQKRTYKQQVNGVLGYANGVVRRGDYNERSLCSACIQRFNGKEHLKPITSHLKFEEFLSAKIRDLIDKAGR
jgi:hypothetical protein